jgi:hypothetical protein
MKSIIATFTLKNDLSNNVLISERDCDNIVKTVERKTHILLLINIYTDKFSKNSTIQVSVRDLTYYLLLDS